MNLGISAVTAGLLALAVAVPSTALADSIYLTWPGVTGTAVIPTVPSVTGAILLKSYGQSFVNNNPDINGITTSYVPTCKPIGITKATDGTSGSILTTMFSTRPIIPSLTITFTTAGAIAGSVVAPVKIVLLNAEVVGFNQSVDAPVGNIASLTDSMSVLASTFEVTYTPQLANGTTGTPQKFGWNCITGTAVAY
jgi:hypothetical protein